MIRLIKKILFCLDDVFKLSACREDGTSYFFVAGAERQIVRTLSDSGQCSSFGSGSKMGQ